MADQPATSRSRRGRLAVGPLLQRLGGRLHRARERVQLVRRPRRTPARDLVFVEARRCLVERLDQLADLATCLEIQLLVQLAGRQAARRVAQRPDRRNHRAEARPRARRRWRPSPRRAAAIPMLIWRIVASMSSAVRQADRADHPLLPDDRRATYSTSLSGPERGSTTLTVCPASAAARPTSSLRGPGPRAARSRWRRRGSPSRRPPGHGPSSRCRSRPALARRCADRRSPGPRPGRRSARPGRRDPGARRLTSSRSMVPAIITANTTTATA